MDTLHKYEIFPTNPIWIYDNVANTLSISDPDNVIYEVTNYKQSSTI